MKRDSTQTKELILNTAITLFAQNGFDGFRMDGLATEAKVNKATIYYHFKDKKTLYENIIAGVADMILELLKNNLKDNLSHQEKLITFIDTALYFVHEHRKVAKIMMTELSYEWKNISKEARSKFMPIIETLLNILDAGGKDNVFRKVNPFLLHSILIGGFNYYLLLKNIFETSLDNKLMNLNLEFGDAKIELKEMILSYVLKE